MPTSDDSEMVRVGRHRIRLVDYEALMERGASHLEIVEAVASVALDRDPRARTVSVEDLTPEQRAQSERKRRELADANRDDVIIPSGVPVEPRRVGREPGE